MNDLQRALDGNATLMRLFIRLDVRTRILERLFEVMAQHPETGAFLRSHWEIVETDIATRTGAKAGLGFEPTLQAAVHDELARTRAALRLPERGRGGSRRDA